MSNMPQTPPGTPPQTPPGTPPQNRPVANPQQSGLYEQVTQTEEKPKDDKPKDEKKRNQGIYTQNVLIRKVYLDINEIGGNISANLEKKLRREIESKCIKEGFVKPRSTKILSYSCGVLKGSKVEFLVTCECLICRPVEGMRIFKCVAKNITKAGIRAELRTEGDEPSPIVVFVARDHHYDNKYFTTIKEEDEINVRVIGQRYELNDTYVSIIAELLEPKDKAAPVSYSIQGKKKNVKLIIKE